MAFDITSVLKSVSDSDTGTRQIIRVPVDRLDADENNFYSLAGIDELADNIALVGLQQPLLVRPGDEPGRYTIVSGHRRCAAIRILLDSEDGSGDAFRKGVPCIVQDDWTIIPGSELAKALAELRVIYANSATRVLSAAEISKQAERIEDLLRKLKDEGYPLPGRIRPHVAKICQVSQTKLARLHAIRENLQPELLQRFDSGEINETVAYRISQEPNAVQSKLASVAGDSISSYDLPRTESTLYGIKNPPRTSPAATEARPRAEDDFSPEAYLRQLSEEDEVFFQVLRKSADSFLGVLGSVESRQHGIEMLKINFRHAGHSSDGCDWQGSSKGLIVNHLSKSPILRSWTEVYDMLCRIALARANRPTGNKAAKKDPPPSSSGGLQWQTGNPTESGMYETRIGVTDEDTPQTACWQRLEWYDGVWGYPKTHAPLTAGTKVFRWVKLPEV